VGKKYAILFLVLLGVALTDTPKTRFLQPRATVLLWSPNRSLILPVQWYISRHPDNRAYAVTCRGACYWSAGPDSMEGENHEAIMPRQPTKVEIDQPGVAVFSLFVYGAGGKVREMVEHRIKVCGSEDTPCGG
jgi:hypothetical protein